MDNGYQFCMMIWSYDDCYVILCLLCDIDSIFFYNSQLYSGKYYKHVKIVTDNRVVQPTDLNIVHLPQSTKLYPKQSDRSNIIITFRLFPYSAFVGCNDDDKNVRSKTNILVCNVDIWVLFNWDNCHDYQRDYGVLGGEG